MVPFAPVAHKVRACVRVCVCVRVILYNHATQVRGSCLFHSEGGPAASCKRWLAKLCLVINAVSDQPCEILVWMSVDITCKIDLSKILMFHAQGIYFPRHPWWHCLCLVCFVCVCVRVLIYRQAFLAAYFARQSASRVIYLAYFGNGTYVCNYFSYEIAYFFTMSLASTEQHWTYCCLAISSHSRPYSRG